MTLARSRAYALIDPRDQRVRYVGCSVRPRVRFKDHCTFPHSDLIREWVAELQAIGLVPQLRIFPVGTERHWIEKLQPDLNLATGTDAHWQESPDRRTIQIAVKVTEAEHAAYHARAEATGREVPGWLRYLAAADLSQVPQTAKRAS